MGKKRSEHAKALQILSEHPEYIGISKRSVISASIEQILYKRGAPITKVDLVFELKSGKVIIVEYKSNGERKNTIKGKGQLETAVSFYQDVKRVPAEGRLITGDSYPILRNGVSKGKQVPQTRYVNDPKLRTN